MPSGRLQGLLLSNNSNNRLFRSCGPTNMSMANALPPVCSVLAAGSLANLSILQVPLDRLWAEARPVGVVGVRGLISPSGGNLIGRVRILLGGRPSHVAPLLVLAHPQTRVVVGRVTSSNTKRKL